MIGTRRWVAAGCACAALAGCGSSDDPAGFPAPATAAPSPPLTEKPAGQVGDFAVEAVGDPHRARLDDGTEAVLDPRARTLTVRGETIAAGVGPTHVVAGDGGRIYVTDTGGHSVLLFRTAPELKLVRRVGLDGSPYGTSLDDEKGKLWVTLTDRNEAVQLTADGLPRVQRRFPTVRQPDLVVVDGATGRVQVVGVDAAQAFDGYPTRLPSP